jgi:hypothetical protein
VVVVDVVASVDQAEPDRAELPVALAVQVLAARVLHPVVAAVLPHPQHRRRLPNLLSDCINSPHMILRGPA